ncbi:C39 family peptidase [Massilia sp. MB5]|uniref:C39 family peptidase n=1 Tax=unclassified Massilia TaxID=2609279 RepID=UPI00067E4836|nr:MULTISPECIES: C39 family peptidase [unclassified Massilia]UMR28955.1 C39 family peptidase [Massilia sp. MB5]
MKTQLHRCVGSILLLACSAAGLAADVQSVGGAPFHLKVTSIKELRYRATVRQQFDFSCGSAAVATLLSYHYDYPVSEQQAFQEMFQNGDQEKIRREGFSLLDMKRFLAARGFIADGFELPLEKLHKAGFPAIVLIAEKGYHHFVVVKGLQGERVLLGDPAGGTRAMSRAAFEAVWQNHLLFVIHDRPGKPRFNELADWRVAPQAMPADVIERDGLARITLPKLGRGEF